jgi:hypothetical protein
VRPVNFGDAIRKAKAEDKAEVEIVVQVEFACRLSSSILRRDEDPCIRIVSQPMTDQKQHPVPDGTKEAPSFGRGLLG